MHSMICHMVQDVSVWSDKGMERMTQDAERGGKPQWLHYTLYGVWQIGKAVPLAHGRSSLVKGMLMVNQSLAGMTFLLRDDGSKV